MSSYLAPKSAFMNLPLIDPSLSLCRKTEWILSSCHVGEEVGSSGVDSVWISLVSSCVQVHGMPSIPMWTIDKVVYLPQGLKCCGFILISGGILFLGWRISQFLLRKLGSHHRLWMISVVFAHCPHMKEVFILDSLFHSNLNVVKIDKEMSSKPSELLETEAQFKPV